MMKALSSAVLVSALLVLTGCGGGDDFSGVYRVKVGFGKPDLLLNITGDVAQCILVNNSTGELQGVPDNFEVDYKNGKMMLDSSVDDIHLTFKRAEDERGLTCINCRGIFGYAPDWTFVKSEPLDVDSILKKQQEKRQSAEEEEVKRIAVAKEKEEKRIAAAPKLVKFQGDWVGERVYKDYSLFITSITTDKGVKNYAFNYQNADKINEFYADFEVDGDELIIDSGKYTLEDDGTKLKCTKNCGHAVVYLKADPDHVNDINYVRKLAGNPQKNSWE